ncbi:hypothetical protein H2204_014704 [Knufia peltigerae]|uniref:Uncharacterized protein n=1 Tax=Knufia peltigerae TaxID=1002370 RepID=A0AA38XHU4_9EURO|nr:hypothetical protein H2204_014704 [Knufia peltigerae]
MSRDQEEWDDISYREKIEAKVATQPATPLSGEYVNVTRFHDREIRTFDLAPAIPTREDIEWERLQRQDAEKKRMEEEAIRNGKRKKDERRRETLKLWEDRISRAKKSQWSTSSWANTKNPTDFWDSSYDDEPLPFVVDREDTENKNRDKYS